MIRIRGGPNPASISVTHVAADGSETMLHVVSASWKTNSATAPATVTLEFDDFEADIAGVLAES